MDDDNDDEHDTLLVTEAEESEIRPTDPDALEDEEELGQPITADRSLQSKRCSVEFFCFAIRYLVALMVTLGSLFAVVSYYPKIPRYNICNDSLAWRSLVEAVASMKMHANIQILASVQNPNYLAVALVGGHGLFRHRGNLVGTFEIPSTVLESMTITDMMVVASFTPGKWEAMSLATEYYKGNLVLDIESVVTFRIPSLRNYTLDAEFKNIHINVADPYKSNRKLCACRDESSDACCEQKHNGQ